MGGKTSEHLKETTLNALLREWATNSPSSKKILFSDISYKALEYDLFYFRFYGLIYVLDGEKRFICHTPTESPVDVEFKKKDFESIFTHCISSDPLKEDKLGRVQQESFDGSYEEKCTPMSIEYWVKTSELEKFVQSSHREDFSNKEFSYSYCDIVFKKSDSYFKGSDTNSTNQKNDEFLLEERVIRAVALILLSESDEIQTFYKGNGAKLKINVKKLSEFILRNKRIFGLNDIHSKNLECLIGDLRKQFLKIMNQ